MELERAKNLILFTAIAAVLGPRLWFKSMQDLPSHGEEMSALLKAAVPFLSSLGEKNISTVLTERKATLKPNC